MLGLFTAKDCNTENIKDWHNLKFRVVEYSVYSGLNYWATFKSTL